MENKDASDFDPADWIEATEAAEVLQRSRSAISRYVQKGLLTSIRKYGRLFVSRKQVETFKRPPRGNPKLLE